LARSEIGAKLAKNSGAAQHPSSGSACWHLAPGLGLNAKFCHSVSQLFTQSMGVQKSLNTVYKKCWTMAYPDMTREVDKFVVLDTGIKMACL